MHADSQSPDLHLYSFKCLTWYEDRKKLTQANDRVVSLSMMNLVRCCGREDFDSIFVSLRMHKKTIILDNEKNKIIG
jgi:hypothetical protein